MSKTTRTGGWSTSDMAALKRFVKESKNKTEAFKKAAVELDRTFLSCQAKWYEMETAKRYMKSAPVQKKEETRSTSTGIHIFKVEDDWKPTKLYATEVDSYIQAIIATTERLKPGQSFGIPSSELEKRYGWKQDNGTASNSIRHIMKKNLASDTYGRISIHEVRDNNKKLTQVRVRRVNEA